MEDLPENAVVDILSRLPVKTIIHCKCVCKTWYDLLSHSYFVNIHLRRSPVGLMIHHNSETDATCFHRPGILKWVEIEDEPGHHHFHHDPIMSLNLNIAPIFQESQIRQVGSVNGLICLWQNAYKNDNTYICNPVTREYMVLPRQKFCRQSHAIIVYGFGVSLNTKEYKVVRIFQGNISPNPTSVSRPILLEAELYTLGTGQWRRLGHVPYWLNGFDGPSLNGQAHWIILGKDSPEKICAFNFDNETFKLFPSPPCEAIENSRIHFNSLGVLNGCLSLIDTFDFQVTIWVMKEYGIKKSWHREVVTKESISHNLDWIAWEPMHLLAGLKDGTIMMIHYEGTLLTYCSRRKTFRNINIFDRDLTAMTYRPSFVKLQNFGSEKVHVF